jgi:hypothetical protein
MLWPTNLSTIAMLNSLHISAVEETETSKHPMSRYRFFWIVCALYAVYHILPGYIAPLLGAVSILCFFPMGRTGLPWTRILGSARDGVGFLSLSFDWSLISTMSPITTPLWALLNQFIGMQTLLWIVVPILFATNGFGIDQQLGADPAYGPNGTGQYPLGFALNSPELFDYKGRPVRPLSFLIRDGDQVRFNKTFYDEHKPIYLTTYFAVEYTASFIVFTAALSHVVLWYGRDIWLRYKSSMKDLDGNDLHAKLMDVYPEVPDSWYISLLVFNVILGIVCCQWGGFDLPWWGVILSLILAIISILPLGIIQAISGQQIGLNVMSEFLIGLIIPGNISGVMAFKTLSYMAMAQGLALVSDLKLGHYMKIPPRAMFITQLYTTVLAIFINLFTSFTIYEAFGRTDTLADPRHPELGNQWVLQTDQTPIGWSGNSYLVFFNAGAIWGAIAPWRFFGPGSPYFGTLLGFLVGFIAPVIPWMLHKWFPSGYWHLVNIPLLAVFPIQIGSTRSDLTTPLIVGIIVNYFIKKYRHSWWKKYAYVMSAGLDAGAAISVSILFFVVNFRADYQMPFPSWILNPYDQENCAPQFFLDCKGNEKYGQAFGREYKLASDEFCTSIKFGGEAR